jgi:hypothetical protein
MRYVIALYDAPAPAAQALRVLAEAGFTPEDVAVAPPLSVPGTGWRSAGAFIELPAADEEALATAVESLGVGRTDSLALAEGVRRGGILVIVRCPTLSAPVARAALDGASPADLATHQARWAADPTLRYAWADAPPLRVDPPRRLTDRTRPEMVSNHPQEHRAIPTRDQPD